MGIRVILTDFWDSLGEENNRSRLTFIGSGIAALALAGWTVYAHIDKKSTSQIKPSMGENTRLSKGDIGGYVDLEGKAISGARVNAHGQDETVTNSKGYFIYKGVVSDSAVTVQVEYDNNQYYTSARIQLNQTNKKLSLVKRK